MTRTTMRTIRNSALLGLAGLGAAGALALSPTTAHAADPAILNVPTSTATAPEQARIADYDGALQPNGYYCGPAATRIALSAHGQPPTFDALAQDLGTTRDGTKSIDDITRVLNQHTGDGTTPNRWNHDDPTDGRRHNGGGIGAPPATPIPPDLVRIQPDEMTKARLLTEPGLCHRGSAAAAGGAAAFADVAATGGPHLGAAGEAERRVGLLVAVPLDQLHR